VVGMVGLVVNVKNGIVAIVGDAIILVRNADLNQKKKKKKMKKKIKKNQMI
jgi:hypothetical protein